ncbi:dicarboxylate/amino acid:cation symporter [Anaplasma capra]|uniref:dicarboxylate/amino acid:cation symporter n=1 Tax=Anaplasma capra TaxID=1562740 RepID=UPI0021D589D8|nr:dicarboxylate/amino acid:cation symporter [Anaplasma capra]MCU7612252.1 dicarboxylate/amino acid:cation symporter [Anaplasma capra]
MVASQSLKLLLLLLALIGAFCFADIVPYTIRSLCYAASLSIKEVLVFTLPFVVFSVVFHSTSKLRDGSAIKTLILLLTMVTLSNSASVTVAHFLGSYLSSSEIHSVTLSTQSGHVLEPLYTTVRFPSPVSSAEALFFGLLCGVILPKILGKRSTDLSEKLYDLSVFILNRIFAPVLPIFILGSAFRMESEGTLAALQDNAEVIAYIFAFTFLYTVCLYFVGSGFSPRTTLKNMRNMLPAVVTGLSTMSSLLTMPVTLAAVKKSTNDSHIADISVPGSVNTHLLGDCFTSVILSSILLAAFGTEVVTTSDYIHFLVYVVLMKFAEAAVAGTGLVLMFPVIEQYLHFSPTMLSLAATLFILLDPLLTAANVFGNGAFSILFIRVHDLLFQQKQNSATH